MKCFLYWSFVLTFLFSINISAQVIVGLDVKGDYNSFLSGEKNPNGKELPIGAISIYGTGSNKRFILKFSVSNLDTITSGYASSVLNPSTSKILVSLEYDPWLDNSPTQFLQIGGIYSEISYTSTAWKNTNLNTAENASIFTYRFGMINSIIKTEEKPNENYVTVLGNLGLVGKSLVGDLLNNPDFLSSTLGRKIDFLWGIDLGLYININKFFVDLKVPIFFGPKIDNLTGGQLILDVGASADFILKSF